MHAFYFFIGIFSKLSAADFFSPLFLAASLASHFFLVAAFLFLLLTLLAGLKDSISFFSTSCFVFLSQILFFCMEKLLALFFYYYKNLIFTVSSQSLFYSHSSCRGKNSVRKQRLSFSRKSLSNRNIFVIIEKFIFYNCKC
jgi:hypothetical protein